MKPGVFWSLFLAVMLVAVWKIPWDDFKVRPAVEHETRETEEKPRRNTVLEEAARLRKEHDSVHIYAVSDRFEVWCVHGIASGKWKDAETLEAARKIVDEYYVEWAGNIVMGHTPPGGRLVE